MGIVCNIIMEIIKSAVGQKVESELGNTILGITIDGVSENGIEKIKDFVEGKKYKLRKVFSNQNMRFMNISENNINFVAVEIRELLARTEITDDVLKKCRYNPKYLADFLWSEYQEQKDIYRM